MDLYLAIAYGLVLTAESQFLLLAQALEVYHARSNISGSVQTKEDFRKRMQAILEVVHGDERRWLKEKLQHANQKTLAERIKEILDLHPSESLRLTANIDDFAAKVRHSRNYYTHYDQELWQSGKVAKGLELRRIVNALADLLQICWLKELGIHGKPIEEVLNRNASTKWADLKKPH